MTLLLLLSGESGTESITVTEPQAADRVLVGENVTIDATEVGTSGTVDIQLSVNNGSTFPITIASGVTLPYVWVPTSAQLAAQAVVRVRDAADSLITDDSGVFVVATTTPGGGSSIDPTLLLSTTIATVTSQTELILTDGTGEDDAYNDMLVVVTDSATATQKSRAIVSDWVGSSKTLTLAAAPTFTVAPGDLIAIVAVSGRTTEFTGAALAKLNQVQAAVVIQEGATAFSTVRPGGKLILKGGDDYADDIDTTVLLPVTDAEEVVYDRLTDADTATIKFAAGRNRVANVIVGTVTKADITKSAGVTYVPIQIARSQLGATKIYNDYRYDLQVTTVGGKVSTPVTGELEVERDNAE